MSHPATARLFIALDLPIGVREQLSAWARLALRSAASESPQPPPREQRPSRDSRHRAFHGMRALGAELLHLTVSFLGSRPVEEIEPLSALVQSCAQPLMGETSLGAPLWLPPKQPRALAVEVHDDSGALGELHRSLSADLEVAGLAPQSPTRGSRHRAFRPHVTVARLRRGAGPPHRTLAPTPQISFLPERLVLYRSWLSPEGASYEALAAIRTVVPSGAGFSFSSKPDPEE
jgi:RNA 2',3'-cyclic 3'-phosphodiesterase